MMDQIDKKEVFQEIFKACDYGNLGMFVGAGFSKAVIGESALGWLGIIDEARKKFELKALTDEELKGASLPELATQTCKKIAENENSDYSEAKQRFKAEISNISNWLPSIEAGEEFEKWFDSMKPAWVITTNYDAVMEHILTGKSISISPKKYFSAPKNVIPIYHLHGTRQEPETIVVTQEDYVSLLRPNDYRQTKLAMTIRESTVLVLGYSLGDINVLSAIDWSKNIGSGDIDYPHGVIQILRIEKPNIPKEYAYRDENENIILEIDDLSSFFKQLTEYINDKQVEAALNSKILEDLAERLSKDNEDFMESFINSEDTRRILLQALWQSEYLMIIPYIQFLNNCLDKVWEGTYVKDAFYMYEKYLDIILDILIFYPYEKMPPKLFQITMDALDKVLRYVDKSASDRTPGNSWSANACWHRRKKDIPEATRTQIFQYAEKNQLRTLNQLIDSTVKEDISVGATE
ncbi:SIR2 family NAD-dependent protein deacylase [Listeria rustica]|uniref:SIR2 family protein n=1 Tax=Listeria rustica TaxID=2713503 RepID=A0A7W1T994_9LIST|nr:SIR2 family protein [Listeria rustica]MBA3927785.1 SIR2 family protein [Listeria rustica]